MFQTFNNSGSSEGILMQNQLEALRSLSLLLVREINSLNGLEHVLENEIKNDKSISLVEEIQQLEARMIRCALIRSMGNQTRAAKLLRLKVTTLNMKIRRYKIDLTEF